METPNPQIDRKKGMMSSLLSSNPAVNSHRSSTRRKKKKKIHNHSQIEVGNLQSNPEIIPWKSDSQQQIYSSKLLEALQQVRVSSSDSSPVAPKRVSDAAYRVLAATAKGRTLWSRAILTSRLKLKFMKKNNIVKLQRRVMTVIVTGKQKKSKVSVSRLKSKGADEEDFVKAGGSELLFVQMQRSKDMDQQLKLADKGMDEEEEMKVKKYHWGEAPDLGNLQDKKLKGQLSVREGLYGKSAHAAAKAEKATPCFALIGMTRQCFLSNITGRKHALRINLTNLRTQLPQAAGVAYLLKMDNKEACVVASQGMVALVREIFMAA